MTLTRPQWLRVLTYVTLCTTGTQLYAAPAALADRPLCEPQKVPSNILFTLDNSGSMEWDHPVDSELWRGSSGAFGQRCYSNHIYNPLWYNPAKRYKAPFFVDSAGNETQLPNANPASVSWDGYVSFFTPYYLPSVDIRTQFNAFGGYPSTARANQAPFYHNYTGATPATPVAGTCYADANYTRVQIIPSVTSYPKSVERTDCSGSSCSYTEELQNFANWASYYRSRAAAVKASVGEAARVLEPSMRVGFQTIDGANNTNSKFGDFLPVSEFSGSHRGRWYRGLYIQEPNYGTPLRRATNRAGEYYRTARNIASGANVTDPIIYSCQKNYHILSTDGYWNGDAATTPVGSTDYDTTIPNIATPAGHMNLLLDVLRTESGNPSLVAGSQWPQPYYKGTGAGVGNTLADVAMYYWMNDLRPTMTNNVAPDAKNGATWQNMVHFGVAFGARGVSPFIDANNDGNADSLPATWAYSGGGWEIDDMWHSTVNGHGSFFNVNSVDRLVQALGNVFADIAGREGSAAAPAVSSPNLSYPSTGLAYSVRYVPGNWTGDVVGSTIDPVTGTVSGSPVWRASAQLTNQFAGTGWSNNRRVITFNTQSQTGVPFRDLANLSPAQQAALNNSQQILNYLRGDKSREDTATELRDYRLRPGPLGDIVNVRPLVVSKPLEIYADEFNPGFGAFYNTNRDPVLYVGANDGMLHAFDARNDAVQGGRELWAYVPGMLYRNDNTGLKSLTYRPSDPLPNKFSHRYYVDGELLARSVDFNRTGGANGSGDWRTLLIGAMRKGGMGYYAIDVTRPGDMTTESAAADKVLWEFTGTAAGQMGYTYGRAQTFKVPGMGWVAAVSSGYNNADGKGYIWFLNPRNGSVLHTFVLNRGTPAAPLNISDIEVFFADQRDGTANRLIATDLTGNVWRIFIPQNLSMGGTTTINSPFASFGKPISMAPTVAVGAEDSRKVWIAVGSGRMLDQSDFGVVITNTVYVIQDGTIDTPDNSAIVNAGNLRSIANNNPGRITLTGSERGWRYDLGSGEHVTTAPIAYAGRLLVIGTKKITSSSDICDSANGCFTSTAYVNLLDTAESQFAPISIGAAGGVSFVVTKSDPVSGTLGGPALLIQRQDGSSVTTPLPDSSKPIELGGRKFSYSVVDPE
ncbi:pilus assembly protein [Parvibium lacunae]|uniref:PilY1 beta-propeller domain-containing protein n=1 Tax=Parvibium lacunae TaxID=1888893 RepID=A0A368L1G6_9BURK|nr:PilC/PilY family type IV pilus protein [Parvibium lacunae]RCS57382.1 hypothetical protein DU000_07915 [Parvibium lacunae]